MTATDDRGEVHLTDEEFAGYIDRKLTEPERDKIEFHLAICSECRLELRAAAQLVRFRSRRKIWYRGSWALAAAAIIVLFVADPLSLRSPEEPNYRSQGEPVDVDDRFLSVVAPDDGALLRRDSLIFVWNRAEEGARFRFTLSDLLGEEIWSAETTDTVLRIPDDEALEPGIRYVWYVDALLLDGRSITTGMRRFEVVR